MPTCVNKQPCKSLLISLLLFFTFGVVYATEQTKTPKYTPTMVDMVPVKVSEHAWYVKGAAGMATDNEGFISNAGFVVTDEGVVVFDALGTPSLAAKLVEQIRQITDQPIVKVIVSHYHADHIYGLQVFKEQGAKIIAPVGAYDYLDSEAAANRLEERRLSLDPWVNDDTYLVVPDVVLDHDTKFSLGGVDFGINFLGDAHSEGDQSLYVEPDGVLFSGDIIFEGRIPFLGSANTKNWLQTLERMEAQKLKALVPGHGLAAKNPTQALSLTRQYMAYMRQVMGEAVAELMEFDEAYSQTDWSAFEKLPAFEAGNRRNAYQVFLSLEAEL